MSFKTEIEITCTPTTCGGEGADELCYFENPHDFGCRLFDYQEFKPNGRVGQLRCPSCIAKEKENE